MINPSFVALVPFQCPLVAGWAHCNCRWTTGEQIDQAAHQIVAAAN
jgi:hypothetical protein